MIPMANIDFDINYDDEQKEIETSKTYKLDYDTERISGFVDNIEALQQSVLNILQTERYAYLIYDWDCGSEIEKYIGEDYDYIVSDIKRSIAESLTQDDRILSVSDFEFTKEFDSMTIGFIVNTIYGAYEESIML